MDFILKEAKEGLSLKNTPQGKCIVGFGVQVRYQKDCNWDYRRETTIVFRR